MAKVTPTAPEMPWPRGLVARPEKFTRRGPGAAGAVALAGCCACRSGPKPRVIRPRVIRQRRADILPDWKDIELIFLQERLVSTDSRRRPHWGRPSRHRNVAQHILAGRSASIAVRLSAH